MRNYERLVAMGAILAGAPEMAVAGETQETVEAGERAIGLMGKNYETFVSGLSEADAKLSSRDVAGTKALIDRMAGQQEIGRLFAADREVGELRKDGTFSLGDIQCDAKIVRLSAVPKEGVATTSNVGVASQLTVHCEAASGTKLDLFRVLYVDGNPSSQVSVAGIDAGDLSLFASVGKSLLENPGADTVHPSIATVGRQVLLQEAYIALLGGDPSHVSLEAYRMGQQLSGNLPGFAQLGTPFDEGRMQKYFVAPR